MSCLRKMMQVTLYAFSPVVSLIACVCRAVLKYLLVLNIFSELSTRTSCQRIVARCLSEVYMKLKMCIGKLNIRSIFVSTFISLTLHLPYLAHANELDNSTGTNGEILTLHEQLHSSALNGSASAQFELGLLFEYGRGVNQDDVVAAHWYEKSAAQNNINAQYRLAVLSDNGWGKPPDKKRAVELYTLAAENGYGLAQHDLAIMYLEGTGTPKSLLQAYKWMRIAVMSGNPLMQKHLKMVAMEMSVDEIAEAEYLAMEWMEGTGI